MTHTIAAAAELTGLSIHTLRYYDREGLMPYVKRNKNGIRLFSEDDFAFLRIITCLKNSGVSLKKIKQFVDWAMLGDATIDLRLQFMRDQKTYLLQQMETLKEHMEMVDYKIRYYEAAAEAGTTSPLDQRTAVPEKAAAVNS